MTTPRRWILIRRPETSPIPRTRHSTDHPLEFRRTHDIVIGPLSPPHRGFDPADPQIQVAPIASPRSKRHAYFDRPKRSKPPKTVPAERTFVARSQSKTNSNAINDNELRHNRPAAIRNIAPNAGPSSHALTQQPSSRNRNPARQKSPPIGIVNDPKLDFSGRSLQDPSEVPQ